jgi:hypothetical protein
MRTALTPVNGLSLSLSLSLSLFLKLGYICYTGRGFIVTILIRFTLYISYIAPIVSPLNPLSAPHKAIARGFFILFHTVYEVNQPHTLPLPLIPSTHTVPILES